MPSILEDPSNKIPPPQASLQSAPHLTPRKTTTIQPKNGTPTPITLYPIAHGPNALPADLVRFLQGEFAAEVELGSTYPMESPLGVDQFAEYWFGTFAVVAILGHDGDEGQGLVEGRDWERVCLGTFYIKPNYPGRCSHICNAGFLTTSAARGKGVGMAMGETYLDFAPKLGYKYSVFNLVFENNTASIKIWDKLGFKVIGRVPGCGRLANSEMPVDALIYGRELV